MKVNFLKSLGKNLPPLQQFIALIDGDWNVSTLREVSERNSTAQSSEGVREKSSSTNIGLGWLERGKVPPSPVKESEKRAVPPALAWGGWREEQFRPVQ